MSHFDLSIVIVTYKEDPAVIERCFRSISASTDLSIETIVVDNAGRGQTADLLSRIIGRGLYIGNAKNEGFSHAVNQGIKQSTGDYVLLLNPDTEFEPDILSRFVAKLEEAPEVGVGSVTIRYPDGSIQESVRRFPTLPDQLAIILKLPHLFKNLPVVDRYLMKGFDYDQTQDVDSIMGAFMLIPRAIINQIGMLDERYYIWFEEVDYCKMVVDAGFKVRHFADLSITHHKGHMFKRQSVILKQKWIRQSMRQYFLKHHGKLSWLILWILSPVFIALAYGSAFISDFKLKWKKI